MEVVFELRARRIPLSKVFFFVLGCATINRGLIVEPMSFSLQELVDYILQEEPTKDPTNTYDTNVGRFIACMQQELQQRICGARAGRSTFPILTG